MNRPSCPPDAHVSPKRSGAETALQGLEKPIRSTKPRNWAARATGRRTDDSGKHGWGGTATDPMSPEDIADANPGLGSDLTDGGVTICGHASRLPPPYRRSLLLRSALDG